MNKVQLSGNAGRDAEVKYTPSGTMVAKATLATSNDYKPKGSDEWVKKPASWHTLVAFGPVAEQLANVKKGDKVSVEGKIQYSDWTDKEGNKRISTEIVVFQVGQEGGESGPATSDADDGDYPF